MEVVDSRFSRKEIIMTSRFRERGPEQRVETYTHCLNGNPYASAEQVVMRKHETISDVVTPDYSARIARGEIINNPCHYTLSELSAGGGYYEAVRLSNGATYTNCGDGSLTMYDANYCTMVIGDHLPLGDEEYLVRQAKSKAIANIDDTPYGFLEDALEWRSTMRLIKNPAEALKNLSNAFFKDVRKHRKYKGSRAAAIADVWLTYRFGVSPLVRSIDDALELAAFGLQRDYPPRRTARGFSQHVESVSETQTHSPFVFEVNKTVEHNVRAGILYEVANPLSDLNYNLGIRLKDLPEAFWAVVPYSFMVDRVINISDFVRGVTNLSSPSLKILAAWYSIKRNQVTMDRAIDQLNASYSITLNGDLVTTKDVDYQRRVWDPSVADALPPSDFEGLVRDAASVLDLLDLTRKRLKA